ncbi:MAG: glycosyltransferase 87 family protein [Candidatus Xenobiia bacterium LiM19]
MLQTEPSTVQSQDSLPAPHRRYLLIGATVLFICLSGIPRHYYMWFSDHLRTYPGDIWYVFDHYVSKGFPFPVEYPSLMRVFVQLVNTATTENYVKYLWATIYFLLPFAVGCTLIISSVLQAEGRSEKNLWIYWLCAPSFLVCGITNYDFVPLFTLLLGLYLAWRDKPILGACLLGMGTAFKVFPAFFLPLIMIQRKNVKDMMKSIAAFLGTWLFFNLPYMLLDRQGFKGWMYPYKWQSTCNYAKSPEDGAIWWPLFKLTGSSSGAITLLVLTLAIGFILWKAIPRRNFREEIWQWGRGIALLFIFFDRIYSPQYHLYLLPFLALSRQRINLILFYMLELPNVCQIIFLFFVRKEHYLLQSLIAVKYLAMILLFIQFYRDVVISGKGDEVTDTSLSPPAEGGSGVEIPHSHISGSAAAEENFEKAGEERTPPEERIQEPLSEREPDRHAEHNHITQEDAGGEKAAEP